STEASQQGTRKTSTPCKDDRNKLFQRRKQLSESARAVWKRPVVGTQVASSLRSSSRHTASDPSHYRYELGSEDCVSCPCSNRRHPPEFRDERWLGPTHPLRDRRCRSYVTSHISAGAVHGPRPHGCRLYQP